MSLLTTNPSAAAQQLDCPTCGAADQSGPQCRRCRSDLRLLLRIQRQRAEAAEEVAEALAHCRWHDALVAAQFLHTLRQDDDSFQLLAVCQLLNRHYQAACQTHQQYRQWVR